MGTCNRCRSTSCTCTRSSCSNPTPYYVETDSCLEDNCQKIYINQFALGLTIQSSWNVPQCGGSAVLEVPGIVALPVGEYIHHPTYGYFEIVSFDSQSEQMSVQNPCFTENSPPGTEIPPCTTFTVTPPPCCEDVGQDGVFLAVDFTAPADGTCIDITVTEQTGLIAGNNISIGTGIYLLNEIKANNVLNICNEGEGIIPGTSVIAKTFSGQYQYPIQMITINACAQAEGLFGKVMICDGLTQRTLTGPSNGLLLTLSDFNTGVAEYSGNETAARMAADTTLQNNINNLTASINALRGHTYSNLSAAKASGVNSLFPSVSSNVATVVVSNTSVAFEMAVFSSFVARISGSIQGANTDDLVVTFDLKIDNFGSGYISAVTHTETFFARTDVDTPMYRQLVWSGFSGPLAVSSSDTIRARLDVSWVGAGASLFGLDNFDVAITTMAVAVEP